MAGRIFCSSCSCKHWAETDGRQYGLCNHPDSCSIIDRRMVGDCCLYEMRKIVGVDLAEEEVTLDEEMEESC